MPNTVQLFVEFAVNKNMLNDLKIVMNDMIESTRSETGTLVYEWHFNDDETALLIYERYQDSQALVTHMNKFSAFAERFRESTIRKNITVLGNPDQSAREVLDTINPIYMSINEGFARFG